MAARELLPLGWALGWSSATVRVRVCPPCVSVVGCSRAVLVLAALLRLPLRAPVGRRAGLAGTALALSRPPLGSGRARQLPLACRLGPASEPQACSQPCARARLPRLQPRSVCSPAVLVSADQPSTPAQGEQLPDSPPEPAAKEPASGALCRGAIVLIFF